MPRVSGLAHRCPPLVCDPVPHVLRVPLLGPTLSGPPSTPHFPARAYLVASRFPVHFRRLSGLRGGGGLLEGCVFTEPAQDLVALAEAEGILVNQ